MLIVGACSASLVGDKIVTFGGSKDPTCEVVVIDVSRLQRGVEGTQSVRLYCPDIRGKHVPLWRTSSVALQVYALLL